jgi:hypothetical protein
MKNQTWKKILLLPLTLATTLSAVTAVSALPPMKPEQVLAPVQRSFVPAGFDSNDNTQIVVIGGYANSCYQVGHTQYSVDKVAKKIDIEVTAYRRQSDACLQVFVPFMHEVSVGLLDKGEYAVSVNQDLRTARTLNVREAPSINPDNYIYAPVQQVIRIGARDFLLRGTFHSSCLNIQDVKVNYEPGEVISVLPTAHYDTSCFESGQPQAWEARFSIKNELNGEYLMHVRSLNGSAINSMQSFSAFDF